MALEPELRPIGVHLITSFVWSQVRRQRRPRLLVVDEEQPVADVSRLGDHRREVGRLARLDVPEHQTPRLDPLGPGRCEMADNPRRTSVETGQALGRPVRLAREMTFQRGPEEIVGVRSHVPGARPVGDVHQGHRLAQFPYALRKLL
ncbi:MAG: hypothetical protein C4321_07945, partial [Chloroflexota bacterium]